MDSTGAPQKSWELQDIDRDRSSQSFLPLIVVATANQI
jgi:hypothetical protein